jgi:hypothetical protein
VYQVEAAHGDDEDNPQQLKQTPDDVVEHWFLSAIF